MQSGDVEMIPSTKMNGKVSFYRWVSYMSTQEYMWKCWLEIYARHYLTY